MSLKKTIRANKIKMAQDTSRAYKQFALDLTRVLLATDVILKKHEVAFKATLTTSKDQDEFDTIIEVYDKIRKDLILDT